MPDDKPPPPGEAKLPAAPPHPIPVGAVSAEPMNVAPIVLDPKNAPKPAPAPTTAKQDPEAKDSFRELIETVVFVVVLVLMLKTFLAEAFVIPTGSMGPTLLGYHHKVTCKQCGYTDSHNASDEAEPKNRNQLQEVVEVRCENCWFWNKIANAAGQGGQQ